MKKTYEIYVEYDTYEKYYVEAKSEDEAREIVLNGNADPANYDTDGYTITKCLEVENVN